MTPTPVPGRAQPLSLAALPGDRIPVTFRKTLRLGWKGQVMSQGLFFRATGPIGDTDTMALPVREIGPAVGYYTQCLGFSLVSKDRTTARLKRDDVEIGLAVNGLDPEQASCWFSVGDVEALWREYDAKGIGPGIIDEQVFDGTPYRVFFAKEPYGVCFCFTQPLGQDA